MQYVATHINDDWIRGLLWYGVTGLYSV